MQSTAVTLNENGSAWENHADIFSLGSAARSKTGSRTVFVMVFWALIALIKDWLVKDVESHIETANCSDVNEPKK